MIFIVLSIVFAFCVAVVGVTYALMDNHRLKQTIHDVDRLKVYHEAIAGVPWNADSRFTVTTNVDAFPYTIAAKSLPFGGSVATLSHPYKFTITGKIEFKMLANQDIATLNEINGSGLYVATMRIRGGPANIVNLSMGITMDIYDSTAHTLCASQTTFTFDNVQCDSVTNPQLWVEFPIQKDSTVPAKNMFTSNQLQITVSQFHL